MIQQFPKITHESNQVIIDVRDEDGLALKDTLGDRVPVAVLTTSASRGLLLVEWQRLCIAECIAITIAQYAQS
jgi:hypothetical protein